MTLASSALLFLIMIALAALPSSSVLLVVMQSTVHSLRNGVATAMGVVAGDLIFVMLAILGLTSLAEQMGTFFVVIKYLAGAYLIWFGIGLMRSGFGRSAALPKPANAADAKALSPGGLLGSFASGLLLTLGDVKAILFYASLLPAFVDLQSLAAGDIVVVVVITIVAVGGTKAVYAVAASRAKSLAPQALGQGQRKAQRAIMFGSGGLMVGAGTLLVLRD